VGAARHHVPDLRDLPASHLIASAKAGDDILAIDIPETAEKLRRLMTLAQCPTRSASSICPHRICCSDSTAIPRRGTCSG
jgi:hypothetical protein